MPSPASKAVETFCIDLTSEHLSRLYDIVLTIWIIELMAKDLFSVVAVTFNVDPKIQIS